MLHRLGNPAPQSVHENEEAAKAAAQADYEARSSSVLEPAPDTPREKFRLREDWTAIHRDTLERLRDHKTLRAGLGKLSPKVCRDIGMSDDEAKAVEALWALCECDDFYVAPPAPDHVVWNAALEVAAAIPRAPVVQDRIRALKKGQTND